MLFRPSNKFFHLNCRRHYYCYCCINPLQAGCPSFAKVWWSSSRRNCSSGSSPKERAPGPRPFASARSGKGLDGESILLSVRVPEQSSSPLGNCGGERGTKRRRLSHLERRKTCFQLGVIGWRRICLPADSSSVRLTSSRTILTIPFARAGGFFYIKIYFVPFGKFELNC